MINPLILIATPSIFAALLSINSIPVVAMPKDISFSSQFLNTENTEYKERPDQSDPTDRLWLAGITDPQEVVTFLEKLRSAADSNDRQALARLVRYPFTRKLGLKPRPSRTAFYFNFLFIFYFNSIGKVFNYVIIEHSGKAH